MTVASYLKKRLELLKVTRLFGVPGNYTAPLLNTILEDENSPIKLTTMSNELVSGYAADGYTRILGRDGLGAVHVTYGVGAMVLFNAIAGCFVENVPIVVINGAPTNKEFILHEQQGLIYQHFDQNRYSNLDVYRTFTCSQQRINNALEAPLQIDTALTACITKQQPVYLEVFEDCWRTEIDVPTTLPPLTKGHKYISNVDLDVAAAVKHTIDLVRKHEEGHDGKKCTPLFLAGIEIQRKGLQENFRRLLGVSKYKYYTNTYSKSVLEETHPQFIPNKNQIEGQTLSIGLGVTYTAPDFANVNVKSEPCFLLTYGNGAFLGDEYFGNVDLGKYIDGLADAFAHRKLIAPTYQLNQVQKSQAKKTKNQDADITFTEFGKALSDHWTSTAKDIALVSDVSFPIIATSEVTICSPNAYIAQANWLGIGHSVGAAVGVKLAHSDGRYEADQRYEPKGDKRVIVVTGDGAFQETCQSVSTMVQLGQNTVVFVLNNNIYGVEQEGVNPNPFRLPEDKINYHKTIPTTQAKLLDDIYPYNYLQDWNYEDFGKLVGGDRPDSKVKVVGKKVQKMSQLKQVIEEIKQNPSSFYIVNVVIPSHDSPDSPIIGGTPGEDEVLRTKKSGITYKGDSYPPPKTF